ncbi:hypothetical protein DM02DRAFT_680512 [Periconia macrospinosa]|uniref:Alpha/beta hydrolase fold-3 domain-containing protein n=1 Tax=Periconia macrospinosa TaxID=97972 RepID=A0A2V1CXM8_9PLEO|nr:hypothetical protein DM02DRAFT_680512 [Periconia macrospinosa]
MPSAGGASGRGKEEGSGNEGSNRPVLIYLHAGRFLFGDLDSGDMNCRILASRLQISVVNVGYRVAPQWKFPSAVEDVWDVVEWHASTALHASPRTGFILGGISSGANVAAVAAYTARDTSLDPPLTALWLSFPVAIMPEAYDALPPFHLPSLLSLTQNAENPLLTAKSLGDIQVLYGCPPKDPRVSFLLNKSHAGLPKRVYLQVCGRDPLRDEAFLWEKFVRQLVHGNYLRKLYPKVGVLVCGGDGSGKVPPPAERMADPLLP